MRAVLIKNIRSLVNTRTETGILRREEMKELPCIDDAFLYAEDGIIKAFGKMRDMPEHLAASDVIDADGRYVLPCWCDSHTHLVFAASREEEFVDKINGLSYAAIAARGGGI